MKIDTSDKDVEKQSFDHKFATETSLHGLRNIVESKRRRFRIMWIIIFCICTGFLIYNVVKLIEEYAEFNAVSEITIQTENEMPFPSVTMCNFNRFNSKKVDEVAARYGLQNYTDQLWEYLVSSLDVNFLYSYYDEEVKSEFLDRLTYIQSTIEAKDGTVNTENLIEETSHNFTDFMTIDTAHCDWLGSDIELDDICSSSKYFEKVITPMGCCFTFNSLYNVANQKANLRQLQGGASNALLLSLDTKQNFNNEKLSNFVLPAMEVGVKVIVHAKGTVPDVYADGIQVATGSAASVGINVNKFINIKKPYGDCDDRSLIKFNTYTRESCLLECKVKFYTETCGCRPVYMPDIDNSPVCSGVKMISCVSTNYDNFAENSCDCPRACLEYEYELNPSTAKIPNKRVERQLHDLTGIPLNYTRENIVNLNIFYRKLRYFVIEQKKGKSLPNLVSDIGGQLGLTIGASLITMSEIIAFLCTKIKKLSTEK